MMERKKTNDAGHKYLRRSRSTSIKMKTRSALLVAALTTTANAFSSTLTHRPTPVPTRTTAPPVLLFDAFKQDEPPSKAAEPAADPPPDFISALPFFGGVALVSAIYQHAGTFYDFYQQWLEIGAAGITGDDFWAPLQFWFFFAAMHPLLQPAIWIGEVLHGSPLLPTDLVPELKGIDPLGDIMPISFIALNVIAIGALTTIAELRTALNIWLLAAFINYIGCGLEGTKDLADYNLALNDDVRGCPTYEQVRQPSMASFDPVKYQGRWYEQAFHDWTQFGDVWDTTLDVELSADGGRWLDDFALRGPAPKAAPLSWDKSPVANGAHYFLYGKLDYPGKQEGVIQESGFGVTFPNYIVDVQKDPNTGEYTEAIQFQCLERGGVRIFEGINFLSRTPKMSNTAMGAMYDRAEKAGMAPYGATPEQMHAVPHRDPSLAPIENSWQGLWRTIGFDKLLTLLEEATHSDFEKEATGVAATNAELMKDFR